MNLKWLTGRLSREPLLIVAVVLASGGIWGFCEVAGEVVEGDSHQLDERIVLLLRNPADLSDPVGPKWIEELMRDITALGGLGLATMLSAIALVFLWVLGYRKHAWLLLAAVLGGIIVSMSMKAAFARPRPDLVSHGSYVYTKSFPSGHTMVAASVYLTLGLLLAELVKHHRLKAFLLVIAVAVTLAVGVSRVYLGVHWPTDVLAGWAAGGSWALICWVVARALHLRSIPVPTADEDEK